MAHNLFNYVINYFMTVDNHKTFLFISCYVVYFVDLDMKGNCILPYHTTEVKKILLNVSHLALKLLLTPKLIHLFVLYLIIIFKKINK